MKTIIFGDIHGRTVWKDVLKSQEWDRVIFLGDYVSTHEGVSEHDQIFNLIDILEFKKTNPDKVILLRGNHDLQHLGYYWAMCSGFFAGVSRYLSSIREEFLKYTQWCVVENNTIFSHAGVSKTWLTSTGAELEEINNLPPSELFAFTPDNYRDYSGDSITQPLTWIRPYSLMIDKLDGYTQVVGHTPVRNIENREGIYYTDCLPHQYLVLENGEFEVKDI